MKGGHVKDAAQGVAEDVPQDVAHNLAFGARVLAQLALRWARNWEGKWHLARAVGKRFRGCHAKRLYVHTANRVEHHGLVPFDSAADCISKAGYGSFRPESWCSNSGNSQTT